LRTVLPVLLAEGYDVGQHAGWRQLKFSRAFAENLQYQVMLCGPWWNAFQIKLNDPPAEFRCKNCDVSQQNSTVDESLNTMTDMSTKRKQKESCGVSD